MAQVNGYVQVEVRGGTAYLHIIPPKPGGRSMRTTDVDEYLRNAGYEGYDVKELHENLAKGQEITFYLGRAGLAFSESMNVKISLDKMKASVTFFPPSSDGPLLTLRDIMTTLSSKGVVFGVDQDAILAFMNDRCYQTEYVFAMGQAPRPGRDGKIEYLFNINPNLKPKHNEDGSVDYHNLNTISTVFAGDVIARLIPEDPGEAGKDITGKEIPTRPVKPAHFSYGKDITLSEDGLELISDVTGHASLVSGKINVSAVYEVATDVDNSVGNIDFDGNVHIKGSVRSGFCIYARGDVEIEGVVEGALIQADGQIIVKQGIHGMQKAILDARGNVIASFIENAKVFSGGYVESGSILYSEVNAAEDVNVLDKKGFIVGGIIRAGGKVESITIGSEMGAQTKIEVGMVPEKKERYFQLKRSIDAMGKKINKLSPVIRTYHDFLETGKNLDEKNANYLRKLVAELEQTKTMLAEVRAEFNGLHQELINSKHSKVIVRKDIFARVEVVVSDLSIITKSKRTYCQFEKRNGEIVVSTIS